MKTKQFHKMERLFLVSAIGVVLTRVTDFILRFEMTLYLVVKKFVDLLAFGSVKIVKIEFSIKGAQFSIKSAKNGSFL